MSESTNAADRGDLLVSLLADINHAISALMDLSVAWSNGDLARAQAKYDRALERLERASRASGEGSSLAQRYQNDLDGVRQELSSLHDFLSNRAA